MGYHLSPQFAAGFFDGEGSVIITRQLNPGYNPSHNVRVHITQRRGAILEYFVEKWGGGLYETKRASTGRTYIEWVLSKRELVREFLSAIRPFSFVKRDEIVSALDFIDRRDELSFQDRDEAKENLAKLKFAE